MSVRPGVASFSDERGSTHRVRVEAASAFEAALTVQAFRGQEWVPPVGPATRLVVEVLHPTVQHQVIVAAVRQWAKATPTSPATESPLLVDSKPGIRLQLHADPFGATPSRVEEFDNDRLWRHLLERAQNHFRAVSRVRAGCNWRVQAREGCHQNQ